MSILLKYAGKDATEAYEPIHPPGTIEEYLAKEKHKGAVDPTTIKKEPKKESQEDRDRQKRATEKPPLSECLSLHDFEVGTLSPFYPPTPY